MLKNRQGEVNINYQGYEMVIINYISNVNIDIKFINNNSIRYKKGYKEFKNGSIKNLYHPEIYGMDLKSKNMIKRFSYLLDRSYTNFSSVSLFFAPKNIKKQIK